MGHAHNLQENVTKKSINIPIYNLRTYIVISLGKSQLFVKAVSILESEAL